MDENGDVEVLSNKSNDESNAAEIALEESHNAFLTSAINLSEKLTPENASSEKTEVIEVSL